MVLIAFCFSTKSTFAASRASLICWTSASNSSRAVLVSLFANAILLSAADSADLIDLLISASTTLWFFLAAVVCFLIDEFSLFSLIDSFSRDSMDIMRFCNSASFCLSSKIFVFLFLIFPFRASAF